MPNLDIKAVISAEDRTKGTFKGLSDSFGGLAATGLSAAAGFAMLTATVKDVASAFMESQKIQAQTEAVLKSTGDIAGVTSREVGDLAQSFMQMTAFSDETIQTGENLLLTFTKIGKDIFPQATETMLNMAQALGGDVSSSAIQLGKALQDPVLGVTALRRVGVNFNEEAQKMIKNMVDTGRSGEAQAFILKELQTEFGGAAKAAGQTFSGQLQILKNNVDNAKESIGGMIMQAISPFIQSGISFARNNQQMVVSLGVAGMAALAFGTAVLGTIAAIKLAVMVLSGPLSIVLVAVSVLMGTVVYRAMDKVQKQMTDTAQSFTDGSKYITKSASDAASGVGHMSDETVKKLKDIDDQIKETKANFVDQMADIVKAHKDKVNTLKEQLDEENGNWDKANKEKSLSFSRTISDMQTEHARKTASIQKDIDDELANGTKANKSRLEDLQLSLAQENEDYAIHYQRVNDDYATDTANAKAEHDKKAADTQSQLESERQFQEKHTADILAVKDYQYQDEIEKLKATTAKTIAKFQEQAAEAIKAGQVGADGMSGAYGAVPGDISGQLSAGVPALNIQSANMGKDMATAFKQAMIESIKSLPGDIANSFKGAWQDFLNTGDMFKGMSADAKKGADLNWFQKALVQISMGIQSVGGHAEGTDNFGGGLTWVGERGPELVSLPNGSAIYSNQDSKQMSGNTTINFNGTTLLDSPERVQELADAIGRVMGRQSSLVVNGQY